MGILHPLDKVYRYNTLQYSVHAYNYACATVVVARTTCYVIVKKMVDKLLLLQHTYIHTYTYIYMDPYHETPFE